MKKTGGKRKATIDIGLAVLSAVTPAGHTWTLEEIAEVCECTRNAIWEIERGAIRKLRGDPRLLRFRQDLA